MMKDSTECISVTNLLADNVKIATKVYQYAIIVSLAGFTIGFGMAGAGGTYIMPSFRQYFNWDTQCYYLDKTEFVKYWDVVDWMEYGVRWPEGKDPRYEMVGQMDCLDFFKYKNIPESSSILDDSKAESYKLYEADYWQHPCKSCCCEGDLEKEYKESSDIALYLMLGSAVGASISGYFARLIGVRRALQVACIVSTSGAFIQILVVHEHAFMMLLFGRGISGIGAGLLSMQATLYLGELATTRARGMIISLQQVAIVTGILSATIINVGLTGTDFGWRVSYGGFFLSSALMFVLMFWVSEQHTWLVSKGRLYEAQEVLRQIRSSETDVQYELSHVANFDWGHRRVRQLELFTCIYRNVYRLSTVVLLHCFQQLSGINAVIFYGPKLASRLFAVGLEKYSAVLYNGINFFSTFICICYVDKKGRISLLWSGTFVCLIGLSLVGILTCPFGKMNIELEGGSFIETWLYERSATVGLYVVLGICIFCIGFGFSWGPITWVYGSEALNMRTKATGMAVGTTVNWLTAALISKCVPVMSDRNGLGIHGTCFFFCGSLIVALFVVMLLYPETAGVPVYQMDQMWKDVEIELGGNKNKMRHNSDRL